MSRFGTEETSVCYEEGSACGDEVHRGQDKPRKRSQQGKVRDLDTGQGEREAGRSGTHNPTPALGHMNRHLFFSHFPTKQALIFIFNLHMTSCCQNLPGKRLSPNSLIIKKDREHMEPPLVIENDLGGNQLCWPPLAGHATQSLSTGQALHTFEDILIVTSLLLCYRPCKS